MDYEPSSDEKNALPLVEGTKVEVLDDSNPEKWLCRRLDDNSKQVSFCWVFNKSVKITPLMASKARRLLGDQNFEKIAL